MLASLRRGAAAMRTAAIAIGLTLAAPVRVQAAVAPVAESAAAAARAELDLGLAAYGRGEYAQAQVHFERSYDAQPDPATLYAWAQASRSAGQCDEAIVLYQRFIDGGAAGAPREAALQNQARCQEQVDRARDPEPAPDPEPPPPRPEPDVTPKPAPTSRRPDRVGLALVGTGAAVIAVGVGVLVAALVQHRTQRETRDYARFDALDARIDGLYIGGGVALGVGAGLVTGGAIRMVRRRRAR